VGEREKSGTGQGAAMTLPDYLADRWNQLHPQPPEPVKLPCRHGSLKAHYPNGGNTGFRCLPPKAKP